MTARLRLGVAVLLAATACSRPHAGPPKASAAPVRSPAPAARASGVSYELRLGKAVFVHYCQTCHGETGAGDGFNAFNLDPRPRDLSDAAFQKKKSDADLADAVRRGGRGVGLSALMPPWGNTLSGRQVDEVVRYVRSLRRPAPAGPPAPAAVRP